MKINENPWNPNLQKSVEKYLKSTKIGSKILGEFPSELIAENGYETNLGETVQK